VPGSYQSITVSWNAVEGASGYQVYQATSEGSYSLLKTTASTNYINSSLKTGTTYYFKVRAYKTSGKTKTYGEFSGAVSATPTLSSVAAANASAYSPTSIKVSWSAVPGRTKYEVWRAQEGGEYTLVKTTTSTYWKDTTRTPFVTYCYYIRVYRSVSGQKVYASSASPTVSAVPILADVTGVNAAGSSTGITVKWSSVSGASGYEVWRSDTADGEYMRIKSTPSKSYTDKDVVPNRTYYYKVQAYRAVNGVRYCSAPTIVSAAAYLGPVTNAKAVRSSSTKIKLTWSAVSGRTGYEIYRSEAPDGEFVSIGTTTRTSYYSSGLTTGTPYYYKIRAYKAVNGVRYYSEELASVTAVSATP
jgi:fibronectin type 3 domain-containing protein